ncbi:MAG TPA: hypothetical protein VKQ06_08955 [Gammaproteobacteria bacterium]|nr:hypothetical protein [Gammaproteobacteria bacterium]
MYFQKRFRAEYRVVLTVNVLQAMILTQDAAMVLGIDKNVDVEPTIWTI